MSCKFLDGKAVAEKIYSNLDLAQYRPKLLILITKKDPVIEKFVSAKAKQAQKLGVEVELWREYELSQSKLEKELIKKQTEADAVIVQLPLREDLDKTGLLSVIDPKKDVDLLNPQNKQRFYKGSLDIMPPVACAVDELLKAYKIDLSGKNILVAGCGELVGKPVYYLFKNKLANVISLDASTPKDEASLKLAQADLIVSGVGAPEFIKPEHIKEGVILIDAGTSSSKLTIKGDISLECCQKASYFAKTPGGVGPVTVACIFKNLNKLIKYNERL